MEIINEKRVIDFYLDEMNRDSISFLKDKPWYKEAISAEILKLRNEEEMHNKIKICIWRMGI